MTSMEATTINTNLSVVSVYPFPVNVFEGSKLSRKDLW